MSHKVVEIAVDSIASCLEAQRGGADRVELCCALSTGGLTPSAALVAGARRALRIPLVVLIRPREGDFVYAESEVALMEDEIRRMVVAGVDGIVSGALTGHGQVDEAITLRLRSAAGHLPFTFHRAFDLLADRKAGIEALGRCGCERVLTSGGAMSVGEGLHAIAETVNDAGSRITVVAGGRLDSRHIEPLFKAGVREFHLSGRIQVKSSIRTPLYETDYFETSHSLVQGVVDEVNRTSAQVPG
ncbi:MAG: copper homeostasis protein CutC [Flavobacteriales bacterium]